MTVRRAGASQFGESVTTRETFVPGSAESTLHTSRTALAGASRLGRLAATALMVALAAMSAMPTMALASGTQAPASTGFSTGSGSVGTSAVIDYAGGFTPSTPALLKKAHIGIVIRYVGAAGWKSLTPGEATALRSGGIDIVAVYETTADWMLGGRSAGIDAAKTARAAIIAAGGPAHPFVYFAADTPTTEFASVNAALRGAASVLGAQNVGVYGSYYVCESALNTGSAAKAWQTAAWSDGRVLPGAQLFQTIAPVAGDLQLDYDSDFAHSADIGQWGRTAASAAMSTAARALPPSMAIRVQSVPTTATLNSVTSTDGVTAWAVGENGMVLHTADKGASWQLQSTPTSATLRGVRFTDKKTGWAVGDRGTVFHTADGGVVWDGQSTPTTAALNSVDFVDANTGWAVGSVGTVLHTTNGGVVWTAQSNASTSTLMSVRFTDAANGWAVGEAGTVLRTGDGGTTWSPQSTPSTATLNGIGAAGSSDAWAVGASGTVLFTENAGVDWIRQSSATTATLNSVHFAGPTVGRAVGASGTVVYTNDGGATWTHRSMPTAATLNSVDVLGLGSAWSVGATGTVLRTTLVGADSASGGAKK